MDSIPYLGRLVPVPFVTSQGGVTLPKQCTCGYDLAASIMLDLLCFFMFYLGIYFQWKGSSGVGLQCASVFSAETPGSDLQHRCPANG